MQIVLKILKLKNDRILKKKKLFIFDKSLIILKPFLNLTVNIYKGYLFRRLIISKYLIGQKFGIFTHTRKPFIYPIKKKNKSKR
jgi:ribosomal protein S19